MFGTIRGDDKGGTIRGRILIRTISESSEIVRIKMRPLIGPPLSGLALPFHVLDLLFGEGETLSEDGVELHSSKQVSEPAHKHPLNVDARTLKYCTI